MCIRDSFVDAMGSDPDIVQLRLDASWELPTIADQTRLTQYLDVTPPDNRPAVFDSMDYAVAPPALLEQGAVLSLIHIFWARSVRRGCGWAARTRG